MERRLIRVRSSESADGAGRAQEGTTESEPSVDIMRGMRSSRPKCVVLCGRNHTD